jgi:hypothetical protein
MRRRRKRLRKRLHLAEEESYTLVGGDLCANLGLRLDLCHDRALPEESPEILDSQYFHHPR